MPRPFMLWPSHSLPHVFLACKLPAFLLFPTPFPPKDSKISRSVLMQVLAVESHIEGALCGINSLMACLKVKPLAKQYL